MFLLKKSLVTVSSRVEVICPTQQISLYYDSLYLKSLIYLCWLSYYEFLTQYLCINHPIINL